MQTEIRKGKQGYSSQYPGWHRNKAHWLRVVLDGTVNDEKIMFLVDMSYELTKK